jgi:adenylyltransferase/sulfurtransferase
MKSSNERYQRQLTLKGFGDAAQNALLQSKVLVIGAGGLGCPVLQYLTAAGIGCIGIVDDDVVSITNLHRQVLYDVNDIGKSKVTIAIAKLRLMNPDVELVEHKIYLDKNNSLPLISKYDVIVDCTDNFSSRYMINDACVLKRKPLVFAAVNRFEGQVAVFNINEKGKQPSGNYRDLFPNQPMNDEVMNCAEAGVLGVLPGIMGSMQANEVIKLITGIGEPLINQLLTYNSLNNQVAIFKYGANEESFLMIPKNENDFVKMNYENECAIPHSLEISVDEFEKLVSNTKTLLIDVRELHELPLVTEFGHTKISLGELKNRLSEFAKEDSIVFFCQSGIRSLQAANMVSKEFGSKINVRSLKGGIVAWKEAHEKELI